MNKVIQNGASGADTFSDNLVGFQITDGTSQLTNANFEFDKVIPEKDNKNFSSNDYSDFISLDDILLSDNESENVKFNNSNDTNLSMFGSLKERIRVSINNILLTFPSAIFVTNNTIIKHSPYTAFNITYNGKRDTTTLKISYFNIKNPFNVELSNLNVNVDNYRNLPLSYSNYVISIDNNEYDITKYSFINNVFTLTVKGKPFSGGNTNIEFFIKLNKNIVDDYFKNLSDLDRCLLDRSSNPIYTAKFKTPTDDGVIDEYVTWPLSSDGYNIEIVGSKYDEYLEQLNGISESIDNYKSNLIIRFLTAPQLFEYDTLDHKAEMIFQIYGQSFDKIKRYIDNIGLVRNVTYDGLDNIPNIYLKEFLLMLGFDYDGFYDINFISNELNYKINDIEKYNNEILFIRNLLINLWFLYKSKGTQKSIRLFLKLIGVPTDFLEINELTYSIDKPLETADVENDILNVLSNQETYDVEYINGEYVIKTYPINNNFSSRDSYPIDDNGFPSSINNSDVFFQKGAGWYKKNISHTSSLELDTSLSVLTGRTKTLITKNKDFTYGEDYFDAFRSIPNLNYGYTLNNGKDRKLTSYNNKNVLNRKNIEIFLKTSNAINSDIYNKSKIYNNSLTILANSTDLPTFIDTINKTYDENISTLKYKKNNLKFDVLNQEYKSEIYYTPYEVNKISDFYNLASNKWVENLSNFIPATTLWVGGNYISNSVLEKNNFQFKNICEKYLKTFHFIPNINEEIKDDLLKFDSSNFRKKLLLDNLKININFKFNETLYSSDDILIPHNKFTFINPYETCDFNVGDKLPLICDYYNNIDIDYNYVIEELINGLNDFKIKLSNEKIHFDYEIVKVGDNNYINILLFGTCINTLNFEYFLSFDYDIDIIEDRLNLDFISVDSGGTISELLNQTGPECKLHSNIKINIGNSITENSDKPLDIFYNCDTFNTSPDFSIITSGNTCELIIDEVFEYGLENGTHLLKNPIELTFLDNKNYQEKILIEGLQYHATSNTTYNIIPNVTYLKTHNDGLKKGTDVYKFINNINISTINDFNNAINNGDIIKTKIETIISGDTLLTISTEENKLFPKSFYSDSAYTFTYTFKKKTIKNIKCNTSYKKNIINGKYDVLPTGYVLIIRDSKPKLVKPYDLIKKSKNTIDSFYWDDTQFWDDSEYWGLFTNQYQYQFDEANYWYDNINWNDPSTWDDLLNPNPCCIIENKPFDKIINPNGEIEDITGVTLSNCISFVYYSLDWFGDENDLFVININDELISYKITKDESMNYTSNINLQQYCVDDPEDAPTIDELTRKFTNLC